MSTNTTDTVAPEVNVRARPHWGRILVWVGVLALLAIHLFYQPLDVLWFRALRKFGLGE